MDTKQNIKKIIIEIPEYLHHDNTSDNTPYYIFYLNFISVATRISSVPIEYRKGYSEAYDSPRVPKKGELIFAFHSFYNEQNVWHIKESPIVPLFSIDKSGYSGGASIAVNPEYYKKEIEALPEADVQEIIATYNQEFYSKRISKYTQDTKITDLPKDFVFFPLQTFDDSVTKFYKFDVVESLNKAASIALEQKVLLLIKPHPFCQLYTDKDFSEYIKTIFQKNPYVRVVDHNIHDLIKNCRSVITFNSGVGIEALIGGATVYSLGTCEWQDATIKIDNLDKLSLAFKTNQPKLTSFQQKLLAYLFTKYWVKATDPIAIEQKFLSCIKDYQFNNLLNNNTHISIPIETQKQYDLHTRSVKNLKQVVKFLEFENQALRDTLGIKRNNSFTFKKVLDFRKYLLVKRIKHKS